MSETEAAPHPTTRRGWLVPYLLEGDDVFGHGRHAWWLDAADAGELPAGPIPQIEFREVADTTVRDGLPTMLPGPPLSADGARRHVQSLVDEMRGGWESLTFLVRWLAWGLSVGCQDRAPEEWNELLYRELQLGRLQAADADVLGFLLSERHGKGWNPNAFYPTPMNVCTCMAQMVVADVGDTLPDGRDGRLASVCDPCVGTGRMLLAASNYSINLWGVDIDATMVDACAVNLALFAPWAVYQTPAHRLLLGRGTPTLAGDQRALQGMDEARQAQGRGPLPSVDVRLDGEQPDGSPLSTNGEVVTIYRFDRHGQGDLFSPAGKRQEG